MCWWAWNKNFNTTKTLQFSTLSLSERLMLWMISAGQNAQIVSLPCSTFFPGRNRHTAAGKVQLGLLLCHLIFQFVPQSPMHIEFPAKLLCCFGLGKSVISYLKLEHCVYLSTQTTWFSYTKDTEFTYKWYICISLYTLSRKPLGKREILIKVRRTSLVNDSWSRRIFKIFNYQYWMGTIQSEWIPGQ